MVKIPPKRLRYIVQNAGFVIESLESESNAIMLPTGCSTLITSQPMERLRSCQVIFKQFSYLEGGDIVLWLQQRPPPGPWDQTHNVRDSFRRGIHGVLRSIGIEPGVGGTLFRCDECELAMALVSMITTMQRPGYDDLYIMPADRRFVLNFDHDGLIIMGFPDRSSKREMDRLMGRSESAE
jgi:hypothetical protein